MTGHVIRDLVNLAVDLLITWAALRYYASRTYDPAKRYSTFAPRFWTVWVDGCVLWPIGFVSAILLARSIPRGLTVLLLVVEGLAGLVYTVVMHAVYGQTVGKMVTKVRVVDYRTGGKISWWQAFLRESVAILLAIGMLVWEAVHVLNGSWDVGGGATAESATDSRILWLLVWLPALWFLVEVVTMLSNQKRRALHDFIAGTIVVRTNIVERPERDGEGQGFLTRLGGHADDLRKPRG